MPDDITKTPATLLMSQQTLNRIGQRVERIVLEEIGLPIEFGLILRTGKITPWTSNGDREVMKSLLADVLTGMIKQEQAVPAAVPTDKKQ